jgi:hypothetical protein
MIVALIQRCTTTSSLPRFPGGTALGFSCRARKATEKHTFDIQCAQAEMPITALDTEKPWRAKSGPGGETE